MGPAARSSDERGWLRACFPCFCVAPASNGTATPLKGIGANQELQQDGQQQLHPDEHFPQDSALLLEEVSPTTLHFRLGESCASWVWTFNPSVGPHNAVLVAAVWCSKEYPASQTAAQLVLS